MKTQMAARDFRKGERGGKGLAFRHDALNLICTSGPLGLSRGLEW